MYKSEQYFVSMPKKHIFLQKGSSTLDDISLQNVIAHPAELLFLFFFGCSITASWAYKKPQKDKVDGLIKWLGTSNLLQNEHLKLKIYNFAFWVPCYKKAWLGGSL